MMRDERVDNIVQFVVLQIATLRKKQGLSHSFLASRAGVTRTAISYIENGKRKPSLFLTLKIAEALNVDLSGLMKEAETTLKK